MTKQIFAQISLVYEKLQMLSHILVKPDVPRSWSEYIHMVFYRDPEEFRLQPLWSHDGERQRSNARPREWRVLMAMIGAFLFFLYWVENLLQWDPLGNTQAFISTNMSKLVLYNLRSGWVVSVLPVPRFSGVRNQSHSVRSRFKLRSRRGRGSTPAEPGYCGSSCFGELMTMS